MNARRRAGRACLASRYRASAPECQRAGARDSRERTQPPAASPNSGLIPRPMLPCSKPEGGVAATMNFGALNPAGTSHYVRLGGAPTVYLMRRHVGVEWRVVFDMARRLPGQAGPPSPAAERTCCFRFRWRRCGPSRSCLQESSPVSNATPAGTWFKHVGQHAHAAGSDVHVADPAQAPIIDAALRAFDAAAVETRIGPADPAQSGAIWPRLADADRAVLRARQLDASGAARIRRACRQPRSLCPPRAGWRGRDGCGVRGQAPDRASQGRRSRFVRFLRLCLLAGDHARHRRVGACSSSQPLDRARYLGLAIVPSASRWRSRAATPIGLPAPMFSMRSGTRSIRRWLPLRRHRLSPMSMRMSRDRC